MFVKHLHISTPSMQACIGSSTTRRHSDFRWRFGQPAVDQNNLQENHRKYSRDSSSSRKNNGYSNKTHRYINNSNENEDPKLKIQRSTACRGQDSQHDGRSGNWRIQESIGSPQQARSTLGRRKNSNCCRSHPSTTSTCTRSKNPDRHSRRRSNS